jgi:drug/metabolite transporter (DMT)-like permease
MLSFGAPEANRAIAATSAYADAGSMWMLALGVFAGCFAGFSYCLLGVAIRYTSARGLPLSTILVSTTLTGFLVLGALSLARLGMAALEATAPADLTVMLAAGVFNAVAYLALAKALHLTGVVFVNALNASQTAMAALVGIAFFYEPPTLPLLAGIGLTCWGLLMMRRNHVASEKARRDADALAISASDDEPFHEIGTVASDASHHG